MNRFVIFGIILVVGIGYYFYKDQEEKNIAKKICSEHFETSDKVCLDKYWVYPFILSQQIAKKNLPEYKKKIKSIEDKISNLKYNLVNFDALEYEPFTINDLRLRGDYKKVIISHKDTGKFFDISCRVSFEYQACLSNKLYDYDNDRDVINSEVVEIINIQDFPEIKKILDELHNHNFYHYKMIIYGDLKKEIINSKIKADLIKLEKLDVHDRIYETSLSSGIYKIKRAEFAKYFKAKFPKKSIQN